MNLKSELHDFVSHPRSQAFLSLCALLPMVIYTLNFDRYGMHSSFLPEFMRHHSRDALSVPTFSALSVLIFGENSQKSSQNTWYHYLGEWTGAMLLNEIVLEGVLKTGTFSTMDLLSIGVGALASFGIVRVLDRSPSN